MRKNKSINQARQMTRDGELVDGLEIRAEECAECMRYYSTTATAISRRAGHIKDPNADFMPIPIPCFCQISYSIWIPFWLNFDPMMF